MTDVWDEGSNTTVPDKHQSPANCYWFIKQWLLWWVGVHHYSLTWEPAAALLMRLLLGLAIQNVDTALEQTQAHQDTHTHTGRRWGIKEDVFRREWLLVSGYMNLIWSRNRTLTPVIHGIIHLSHINLVRGQVCQLTRGHTHSSKYSACCSPNGPPFQPPPETHPMQRGGSYCRDKTTTALSLSQRGHDPSVFSHGRPVQ